MSASLRPDLAVTRVRHELKRRSLRVARVTHLTPHLVRVTLEGEELSDFISASFDDHVKVFFPSTERGAGEAGVPAPLPVARDFTPRRYDREARELDLEFALHDAGPASAWAAGAQPGQDLIVGGPRGSFVIPTAFDWHILVGDDTALPAIARRLEELPAGSRAFAVVEVDDESGTIPFDTRASLSCSWVYRDGAGGATPGSARATPGSTAATQNDALLQAVRALPRLAGEGYVWAAGEAAQIRAIRSYFVTERGIDKSRIRAASYWKRGAAAVHENIED